MSAFYVGQSVRLARVLYGARSNPIKLSREGHTCVIGAIGERMFRGRAVSEEAECCIVFSDGATFGALFEQLEPIIPPGLESIEEINALYEPAPVGVLA